MKRELMGPPSPRKYPLRTLEGRTDEPEPASLKDLWPVALGHLLDLGSTALVVGKPFPGDRVGVEANPLPGMGSDLGRAGWSLAELLATHFLTKNRPKLRSRIRDVRPGISGALAMHNFGMAQGRDVEEMRLTGMRGR